MNDDFVKPSLHQLPYFERLAEIHLDQLARQAARRVFAADEVLFLEGEPSAGLWIIKTGRVKAFKLSPEGQEYILRFFSPSDTFNDLAALDDAPNPISVMAVTDGVAWVIPSKAFLQALQVDHDMALAVVEGLVGRIRFLVGRIEDLALRPVTARLARFLLGQIEKPSLDHPAITRALIAHHLAMTPESLSRSLRVLEDAGAIRFDRHAIVVIAPDILREQAQL